MKYMSKVGGSWKCSVCDYESKLKARTFEHVEAKHVQSQGYNCSICQKFCSTYNALKLHKSRYHRQLVWRNKIAFIIEYFLLFPEEEIMSKMLKSDGQWSCTVCSYSSVLKHNVLKHVEAKHVATSGYNCVLCQKFCSSLNALKLHESRYHKRQQY